jgi:hypothetical protein
MNIKNSAKNPKTLTFDVSLWDVHRARYMTYAEIAQQGDRPPELVAQKLAFQKAQELVKQLGFGYSIHESKAP